MRRGRIYQFRIRVPKDVRDVIGKSHLSRSLRTDPLTVANRLGAQCALEAAAMFADARGGTVSTSLGNRAVDAARGLAPESSRSAVSCNRSECVRGRDMRADRPCSLRLGANRPGARCIPQSFQSGLLALLQPA